MTIIYYTNMVVVQWKILVPSNVYSGVCPADMDEDLSNILVLQMGLRCMSEVYLCQRCMSEVYV